MHTANRFLAQDLGGCIKLKKKRKKGRRDLTHKKAVPGAVTLLRKVTEKTKCSRERRGDYGRALAESSLVYTVAVRQRRA